MVNVSFYSPVSIGTVPTCTVAAANFAVKSDRLLNRAGAPYFCTPYYCVQKRGDIQVVLRLLDEQTGSRQNLSAIRVNAAS